jgi:hypothetical protein
MGESLVDEEIDGEIVTEREKLMDTVDRWVI